MSLVPALILGLFLIPWSLSVFLCVADSFLEYGDLSSAGVIIFLLTIAADISYFCLI
jgi:hypothetical protein